MSINLDEIDMVTVTYIKRTAAVAQWVTVFAASVGLGVRIPAATDLTRQ